MYRMFQQLGLYGHSLESGGTSHSGTRQEMSCVAEGEPARDPTLQHPRCVFQILKRHFARYTPEMVAAGVRLRTERAGSRWPSCCAATPDASGPVPWSMRRRLDPAHDRRADDPGRRHPAAAARQHRAGPAAASWRCAATATSRARPTSRPCTTCCPATCRSRGADEQHETLDDYVEHEGLPTGYWANFPKFIVSLLKAWYGDAATAENDFGFDWLPRIDGDYSQLPFFDRMAEGEVKGYFLLRPEPGRRRAQCRAASRRPAQPRLAGGARLVRDRERRLLEERPRAAPPTGRRSRPRCSSCPAAPSPEKDGSLHQHPAAAAVARQGARPAGRLPLGRLVRLQPRQAPEAALRGVDRPARSGRCSHLTWDYEFDEPPRLPDGTLEPDRGRAGSSRRCSGDQRLPPGRDRSAHRPASAGVRLRRAARTTARRRAAAGSTAASSPSRAATAPASGGSRRQSDPARVGLRLAAQPPHPVQPRLGGPRGHARGRSARS